MARKCDTCGRGPTVGASRSHSHIKSKKWVYPNLQIKKIGGRRLLVCTSCIKDRSAGKKA